MAVPHRRTDWVAREAELRERYGIIGRWQPLPPSVRAQLDREKEDERAYNASLPGPTGRPKSARERKSKRATASAATTSRKRKKAGSKKNGYGNHRGY